MGKTTNLAPSFSFASLRENQRRPDYLPDEETEAMGSSKSSGMNGFFVPDSLIDPAERALPGRLVLSDGAGYSGVPPLSAFLTEEEAQQELDRIVNGAQGMITAQAPYKMSNQPTYAHFKPLSCHMVWSDDLALTRPLEMVVVEEDFDSSNCSVYSLAHYTYDPSSSDDHFYLVQRLGPKGVLAEDTPYQRKPGASKVEKMIDQIKLPYLVKDAITSRSY